MLMSTAKYTKWLEIVAIRHSMPRAVACRMDRAFDWAEAVFELPSLSAEEIASAAASHFDRRCFF